MINKKTFSVFYIFIHFILLLFSGSWDELKGEDVNYSTKTKQAVLAKVFLLNLNNKKYSREMVNFEFINTDFLKIVREFSKKFNQSISVSPDIKRTVITSIIYNIPLDQAFVVFLEQNQLEAIIKNDIVFIQKIDKGNLLLIIIFIFIILVIVLIGYLIFSKRASGKKSKQCQKNTVNSIYSDEISGKLMNLFEVKKIYRMENLTLTSLSEELSIQPYLLSRIINEKMNQTFSQLLNHYRIAEAKQLLLESDKKKQQKILDIAYSAGFGNKATFNKIFKKDAGMTPTQFRENGLK